MKHSRPTRLPRRLIVATPALAVAAVIAGPLKAHAATTAPAECLADLLRES